MTSPANHLDFAAILPLFPRLERLILCFQTKRCGVDFRWNMFGLTEKEGSHTQAEETGEWVVVVVYCKRFWFWFTGEATCVEGRHKDADNIATGIGRCPGLQELSLRNSKAGSALLPALQLQPDWTGDRYTPVRRDEWD